MLTLRTAGWARIVNSVVGSFPAVVPKYVASSLKVTFRTVPPSASPIRTRSSSARSLDVIAAVAFMRLNTPFATNASSTVVPSERSTRPLSVSRWIVSYEPPAFLRFRRCRRIAIESHSFVDCNSYCLFTVDARILFLPYPKYGPMDLR